MKFEQPPAPSSDEMPKEEKNIENIQNPENIIITLPEDPSVLEALEEKFGEYNKRLSEQKEENPYQSPEFFADTIFKIFILENLLQKGEVKIYASSKEFYEKHGFLDADVYHNAYRVIEDYVKTGGKNNVGGTGLNVEQE